MSSDRQDPIAPLAGQESVWDCTSPPRIEPSARRIRVVFGGVTIADTTRALTVVETGRPPVYYVPPDDVLVEHLVRIERQTICAFKGVAIHYAVIVGEREAPVAAWCYPDPIPEVAAIARHLAFCPHAMDECWIDDRRAISQPDDDDCGWLTPETVDRCESDPVSHAR